MNTFKNNLREHRFLIDDLLPPLHQQIDKKNMLQILEKKHLFIKMLFYYKKFNIEEVQHILNDNENLSLYLARKSAFLISGDIHVQSIYRNTSQVKYLLKDCTTATLNYTPLICSISNSNFRGASHPHMLGLIFLNESKFETLFEKELSIIHELAHQELFLINMLDRLVTSDTSYKLIHSPYQGVKRPAIGRLHSAHALFRMIQLCDLQNEKIRSDEFRKILKKTVDTFQIEDLTELGNELKVLYKEIT